MALSLSDAIRLGSMDHPQAFGVYEREDGASCALGSAARAAGFRLGACDGVSRLFLRWPYAAKDAQCPECQGLGQVANAIVCLNDLHGWTRERIADWVVQFEPTAEAAQPLAVAVADPPVAVPAV